jgi:hypothetical protein
MTSLQAVFIREPPNVAERAIARRAPNFRGNCLVTATI